MPKILVTEFVSSTSPHDEASIRAYWELVLEGFSMAYTAAKVLKDAGAEVHLTLSYMFENMKLPFRTAIVGKKEDYFDVLEKIETLYDYVLLIAPPRELMKASKIVKDKILGPTYDCILTFSNKKSTYKFLEERGIQVPRTKYIRKGRTLEENLPYPVVVKPVDMAGGAGITLVKTPDNLEYALNRAWDNTFSEEIAVQEFLVGVHASISVISDGSNVHFISNNIQLIDVGSKGELKYYGGITPLRNSEMLEKSLSIINKMLKGCNCLRGYFGLDVVWVNWRPYVVEVNPRLTTSFIGLAEVLGEDLGKLILYSVGEEKFHRKTRFNFENYSYYVILDRTVKTLRHERILQPGKSKRSIVVGVAESIDNVFLRVRELRSNSKV